MNSGSFRNQVANKFDLISLLDVISNFVGYLMPKPPLQNNSSDII